MPGTVHVIRMKHAGSSHSVAPSNLDFIFSSLGMIRSLPPPPATAATAAAATTGASHTGRATRLAGSGAASAHAAGPPNALRLVELGVFGTRWLPTRSPPHRDSCCRCLHWRRHGSPHPACRRWRQRRGSPRPGACAWHLCRDAGHIAASCRLLPGLVLPRIRLPVLHGVATRGAAEFICRGSVAVRGSAAVLRVMLPVAVAPIAGRLTAGCRR